MIPIRDTVPRRRVPVMTWSLIAVNVAIFLFELSLPPDALESLFYLFGLVPARYSHPDWALAVGFPIDDFWPFITSQFLHGGWLHIIGNMWTLWIFGDNVEDRMGPWRFLAFYLITGIIAGLTHWFTNPDSVLPTVGASGAIAGVLGAYFVLFPKARIIGVVPIFFWPFFIELPAVAYLLLWFVTQIFAGTMAGLSNEDVGGVAFWAHVGGFIAGMALRWVFVPSADKGPRRFEQDELGVEGAWARGP